MHLHRFPLIVAAWLRHRYGELNGMIGPNRGCGGGVTLSTLQDKC